MIILAIQYRKAAEEISFRPHAHRRDLAVGMVLFEMHPPFLYNPDRMGGRPLNENPIPSLKMLFERTMFDTPYFLNRKSVKGRD
jgi:hypothetical protein